MPVAKFNFFYRANYHPEWYFRVGYTFLVLCQTSKCDTATVDWDGQRGLLHESHVVLCSSVSHICKKSIHTQLAVKHGTISFMLSPNIMKIVLRRCRVRNVIKINICSLTDSLLSILSFPYSISRNVLEPWRQSEEAMQTYRRTQWTSQG